MNEPPKSAWELRKEAEQATLEAYQVAAKVEETLVHARQVGRLIEARVSKLVGIPRHGKRRHSGKARS